MVECSGVVMDAALYGEEEKLVLGIRDLRVNFGYFNAF